MIRVRNLKVWFPLRRGLARELTGHEALWVRAVDGVSFDVRRAEVFCLVGESGCGKTTTGKALLRLEDATEGDIFFEMPDQDYAEWEKARAESSVAAKEKVDSLRRKYSFTWQETTRWTALQLLLLVGMVGAAFAASVLVPMLLLAFTVDAFANIGLVTGLLVLSGVLLGVIGSLPPTRPYRRTPLILALLSLVSINVYPVLGGLLFPRSIAGNPPDVYSIFAQFWNEAGFAMLYGVVLAAGLAGGISKAIVSTRLERQGLKGIKMQTLRRRLHLIFQDPYESLNPKQSIFEIVAEPLQVNKVSQSPDEVASLVSESLEDAGLRPAEEFMFRFPHELSGGQRQRVSIAAALALQPDFVVADEPVSMLDVSIRTQILELMMELRKTRALTYLFITHDLSLAWILADRIAVMYLGKIVEQGTAEQIVVHPKHPYTQALISVVPSPDPRHKATRVILQGERPDPIDIPTGCRFHPRCPMAFERCGWNASELKAALEAVPGAMPAQVGAMTADTPKTLRIQPKGGSADSLANELRTLFQQKRDEQIAFRGVAEVSAGGGQVTVTMHAWSEPELLEVSPGNTVACHLVHNPPPQVAPVPAAA